MVVEFLAAFLIFITLVLSCLFGCVTLNREKNPDEPVDYQQTHNQSDLLHPSDANESNKFDSLSLNQNSLDVDINHRKPLKVEANLRDMNASASERALGDWLVLGNQNGSNEISEVSR